MNNTHKENINRWRWHSVVHLHSVAIMCLFCVWTANISSGQPVNLRVIICNLDLVGLKFPTGFSLDIISWRLSSRNRLESWINLWNAQGGLDCVSLQPADWCIRSTFKMSTIKEGRWRPSVTTSHNVGPSATLVCKTGGWWKMPLQPTNKTVGD